MSELFIEQRSWDEEKVRRLFLPIDAETIVKIRIPSREEEDFVAWHPDQHGRFSVRNAYSWALRMKLSNKSSRSSGMNPRNVWNIIWKCNIPQKVNIFGWKTVSNGLATLENKVKWTLEREATCQISGTEKEDTLHALFRCPQAKFLWAAIHSSGSFSSVITGGGVWPFWQFDQMERLPDHE